MHKMILSSILVLLGLLLKVQCNTIDINRIRTTVGKNYLNCYKHGSH